MVSYYIRIYSKPLKVIITEIIAKNIKCDQFCGGGGGGVNVTSFVHSKAIEAVLKEVKAQNQKTVIS